MLKDARDQPNVIKSRIQRAQTEYTSSHTLRAAKGEALYVLKKNKTELTQLQPKQPNAHMWRKRTQNRITTNQSSGPQ